jgi:hypothetical protein
VAVLPQSVGDVDAPTGFDAADPWATAALADTASMTANDRSCTFFI